MIRVSEESFGDITGSWFIDGRVKSIISGIRRMLAEPGNADTKLSKVARAERLLAKCDAAIWWDLELHERGGA